MLSSSRPWICWTCCLASLAAAFAQCSLDHMQGYAVTMDTALATALGLGVLCANAFVLLARHVATERPEVLVTGQSSNRSMYQTKQPDTGCAKRLQTSWGMMLGCAGFLQVHTLDFFKSRTDAQQ